jgi:hypothetical protein
MKRALLLLVGLVGLYFAGRTLYRLLAPAETKIRWTLEGGVAGFNAQRMDACLEPLAPAFLDATAGIGRDEVREALVVLFLQGIHGEGVPYRLELPRDDLSIEFEPGNEAAAKVGLVLRFFETSAATERLVWEVRVRAEMVRQEPGWRVLSSTHETLAGKRIR